jgi:hypothetical protein
LDGFSPTFEGVAHPEPPTPDQLRTVVDYTRSHRQQLDTSFDVVLEAVSDDNDPELVCAYADAGLTWWIEKLGWFRGSVDYNRQRIQRGPPASG